MPLDDASTALLAQLAGSPPFHTMIPDQAREFVRSTTGLVGTGPDMERVLDEEISADGVTVPVRVLVPSATPRGVITFFHGGAWVTGGIDEFDTLGRELAHRSGCAVVLVGYRLAPENPYPAALDDCWTALLWVDDRMERLVGARVPLLVAGDSAGGNLAAVVALRATRRGGPDVALQVLIYPNTDHDLDRPSYLAPENQLLLSRATMVWAWANYVPDVARREEPEASPLRAPDLTGLPPAVVVVAEYDPLADEIAAYAGRLSEAGVPVDLRTFPGQMHGFVQLINVLPAGAEALDHIAAAVGRALPALASD